MKFGKVGPGLYERTNTPKRVEISEKFADAVRREGHSRLLERIIEQDARSAGQRKK